MKDNNFEFIFGLGGFVVGLIGLGYAYGSRKRLNGICDKLDSTIDNVSKSIDVDVPDYIVQEAIDKAVERRVQQETINAVRKISKKIEDDIDLKVRTEIDVRSSTIRQEVKNKIAEEVAKISEFNNNLEHVSKIYSSIADKMAGIGSNKDFKISLG